MKKLFFSLLLLLFIVCTSSTFSIKADMVDQPVTVNKKVKINKTFKIHKALNIKKSELTDYTITSSNTKAATVNSKGTVKGLKKGTAYIHLVSRETGDMYASVTVKVKNNYTKKQLRLMSAIIYSEAGAECYAGKRAIGIVIMNRIKSSDFPNTLDGVIYQPNQFGPVRNGSLNNSLALYDNGQLDKKCIKAAKASLNGDTTVNYKKQTIDMSSYLFFSGYISGSRLKIQNHQFK